MIHINAQKRMAAQILKCGISKVWIDPDHKDEVDKAVTKADVRRLIKKGYIKKKKVNEQSRGNARKRLIQKKRGRMRGPGKRKGKKSVGKENWMKTVRALRKYLKEQRDLKKITPSQYRKLYMMVKGGRFRSKTHLKMFVKEMKRREENTA